MQYIQKLENLNMNVTIPSEMSPQQTLLMAN